VHFVCTPLAGHDVEVAVFPMEEMGTFMEEFGVVEGSSIDRLGRGMRMPNANGNGNGDGAVVEQQKGRGGHFFERLPQGGDERTGKEGLHFNKFDAGKAMTTQGEELRGLVYGMQSLVSNNQLSESLKVELCRLYAVDVDVMLYLGFQVAYCKG
jgi:hypothetical protein